MYKKTEADPMVLKLTPHTNHCLTMVNVKHDDITKHTYI